MFEDQGCSTELNVGFVWSEPGEQQDHETPVGPRVSMFTLSFDRGPVAEAEPMLEPSTMGSPVRVATSELGMSVDPAGSDTTSVAPPPASVPSTGGGFFGGASRPSSGGGLFGASGQASTGGSLFGSGSGAPNGLFGASKTEVTSGSLFG